MVRASITIVNIRKFQEMYTDAALSTLYFRIAESLMVNNDVIMEKFGSIRIHASVSLQYSKFFYKNLTLGNDKESCSRQKR